MKKTLLVGTLTLMLAFVGCAGVETAQTEVAQAPLSLEGAWEIQTDSGAFTLYFMQGTFTVYRSDGVAVLFGLYHTGAQSPLGLRSNTRDPQHTGNLFLMFDGGMGFNEMGFTYELSSSGLVLSSDSFDNYSILDAFTEAELLTNLTSDDPGIVAFFRMFIQRAMILDPASLTDDFVILSGAYTRSSFTESIASHPLAGFWRFEGTDSTEIFRFSPHNSAGVILRLNHDGTRSVAPFSYTYASGTGSFTYIHGGATFSFTVHGNVLSVVEWGDEFTRQ